MLELHYTGANESAWKALQCLRQVPTGCVILVLAKPAWSHCRVACNIPVELKPFVMGVRGHTSEK